MGSAAVSPRGSRKKRQELTSLLCDDVAISVSERLRTWPFVCVCVCVCVGACVRAYVRMCVRSCGYWPGGELHVYGCELWSRRTKYIPLFSAFGSD